MPGPVFIVATRFKIRPIEPAQTIPVIQNADTGVAAVAGADNGAAIHIAGAPGAANLGGSGGQQFLPSGQAGRRGAIRIARPRNKVRLPVERPAHTIREGSAYRKLAGIHLGKGGSRPRTCGDDAPIGANQAAHLPAARDFVHRELLGIIGDVEPLDPLNPPLLPRELKDAVDADPGNAGFSVGQPALLGGDKAAELTAFPEIDGVIPLVAIFAGGPGFRLAESVGLVNAAVEGLAPVLSQGFQDGGGAVVMGKGLPVGTVPGDGPGLG